MAHPTTLALLTWYADNARDLPWRKTEDPYAIWVAEIMLQQTRVETVIPYYERWMARFPSIAALAKAQSDDVLQLWEGLGYYRRAHNLHRAAREIMSHWGGELPMTLESLKSLPGIGDYTAAAIAALAFDLDAIALDGNLRRVFARLIDLEIDPRQPIGRRRIMTYAEDLLPSGRASAFNQALMDLGAVVCTARTPHCNDCPLASWCLSYERGTQELRPVRSPRNPVPHYHATAGVIWRGKRVLIGRRPQEKLLGGLWEFPGGKQDPNESLAACLKRELQEELGVVVRIGTGIGEFKHAYTHFRITVHAFEVEVMQGEPQALDHVELAWVRPEQLADYPMGKIDRSIARTLLV